MHCAVPSSSVEIPQVYCCVWAASDDMKSWTAECCFMVLILFIKLQRANSDSLMITMFNSQLFLQGYRHIRRPMLQPPIRLLALSTFRNILKWPHVSENNFWRTASHYFLMIKVCSLNCEDKGEFQVLFNELIYPRQLFWDGWILIRNKPGVACGISSCMITAICGKGIYWASMMSSIIRITQTVPSFTSPGRPGSL